MARRWPLVADGLDRHIINGEAAGGCLPEHIAQEPAAVGVSDPQR